MTHKVEVGISMVAPYGVYVDRVLVAEYDAPGEAEAHFQTLLDRPLSKPPQSLIDCFIPEKQVQFKLVRCDGSAGWMRLWQSTETRNIDGSTYSFVKYHVTDRDSVHYLCMPEMEMALANFEISVRGELGSGLAAHCHDGELQPCMS